MNKNQPLDTVASDTLTHSLDTVTLDTETHHYGDEIMPVLREYNSFNGRHTQAANTSTPLIACNARTDGKISNAW
jgi:hypothetical protein